MGVSRNHHDAIAIELRLKLEQDFQPPVEQDFQPPVKRARTIGVASQPRPDLAQCMQAFVTNIRVDCDSDG